MSFVRLESSSVTAMHDGYTKEQMTAHGFRSAGSTILNESGFDPDVIEALLGHKEENEVRRAYNRATYWKKRVELMQAWADLLDQFRLLKYQ
ncbi:tyrosine-type recombinase/integrase [Bradyrhizobium sp. 131]|uniref:tyrosine-type recombinase/integrase n=1 Tax=unclassified Bradyrhizobium TaxID=2631580 RepID=UPI0003A5BCB1